jgi:hypothetical protein
MLHIIAIKSSIVRIIVMSLRLFAVIDSVRLAGSSVETTRTNVFVRVNGVTDLEIVRMETMKTKRIVRHAIRLMISNALTIDA